MFVTIRPKSWSEVKAIFDSSPVWVFRGQARAEWPLETTLYREATRVGLFTLTGPHLLGRERFLIEQFQRFAHHYRSDLPPDDDLLAWLALIQHYGGPTRLLDFTASLYIAAFFAVDATDTDAAIWAINLSSLEIASYNKLNFFPVGSVTDILTANSERLFFHESQDPPAVLQAEPSRLHERLWIQKGLFLVPTDPDQPFLTNLASSFNRKPTNFSSPRVSRWSKKLDERAYRDYGEKEFVSVIKVVLHRGMHGQILNDLESMNISAATLLPGLDGFARSLRHRIWPSALWLHEGSQVSPLK